MGRRAPDRGRPARRLAVQGQGVLALRLQATLHPRGQHRLQMHHRQARQQAAVERAGGRVEALAGEVGGQHLPVFSAPLPHRFERVAIAQQRQHQRPQQEGQRVAPAPPPPRVRHPRQGRPQRPHGCLLRLLLGQDPTQHLHNRGRLHLKGLLLDRWWGETSILAEGALSTFHRPWVHAAPRAGEAQR